MICRVMFRMDIGIWKIGIGGLDWELGIEDLDLDLYLGIDFEIGFGFGIWIGHQDLRLMPRNLNRG